ncbi:hypothetical protein QQ008_21295 [Fulvivirgaceae bacterium BMA10]|uniref:Uncharacterized protein n=1 Tax=Splendidivirga corallicola TaxID=3051826 RepID=A0ABT8KVH0_9BACT|nr:hypothetical protein [Fulvivirgaceae bacterium BMA10]
MADPTRPIIIEETGDSIPKITSTLSSLATTPESSRDPLSKLAEILSDPNISETYKEQLILLHKNRFKNRRSMAYLSLIALVVLFASIIVGVWVDGLYTCDQAKETCREGILLVLDRNKQIVIWISGFLTSIVGAYYGVSALRPSS